MIDHAFSTLYDSSVSRVEGLGLPLRERRDDACGVAGHQPRPDPGAHDRPDQHRAGQPEQGRNHVRSSTTPGAGIVLRPVHGMEAARWIVAILRPDRAERLAVRTVLDALRAAGRDVTT
jgi:hypothetical protein